MTFFNMAMEVKKYNIEEIVCISKCASEANERKTKLFLLSERYKISGLLSMSFRFYNNTSIFIKNY